MTVPPDPASPLPRRRWLRLSLRGLMVLVVLIAVPAGWVANKIRTQRRAIAAVRAAGAQIRFDFQKEQVGVSRGRPVYRTEPMAPKWLRRWLGDELFQNVQAVTFRVPASPATLAAVAGFDRLEEFTLGDLTGVGDGLRHLRGLSRLQNIRLCGPGVTDAMLGDLASVRSLRRVEIGLPMMLLEAPPPGLKSTVTDAGIARLASLPDLEGMVIRDCPGLTDAGAARLVEGLPRLRTLDLRCGLKSMAATLPALARHHPDLRSLDLDSNEVTDADLAAVEGMSRLEVLHLPKTRITDAGLLHLRPLKNLTRLSACLPEVTDQGVRSLSGLTRLNILFLKTSKVTDAGLVHLAGLINLKRLDLNETLVTDAGMATLATLAGLEEIGLSGLPHLTDAGLVPLRALKNLRYLNVSGSKVTPEGAATLKQAIPTLRQVTTQVRRRPAPVPAAK